MVHTPAGTSCLSIYRTLQSLPLAPAQDPRSFALWRVRRGDITPVYYAPLEVVGIYWSFVDTVWIVLFPAIYLVGRS